MSKEFRKESKVNFTYNYDTSESTIQTGCLMRMADSLEKIAEPFSKLITEKESLERRNASLWARINHQEKVNAGLKGQITKLNKRLI